MGSSELGAIHRRTVHPSSIRPRHTDRVVARRTEEPSLTVRIRRRHTTAALSAVQSHRGTEGSNPFPSSGESMRTYSALVGLIRYTSVDRATSDDRTRYIRSSLGPAVCFVDRDGLLAHGVGGTN